MEIAGDALDLNATRWPAMKDGERIGQITSAVYSPRLKKNIGYAMLPIDYTSLGTQLTVSVDGEVRSATVVPMPYVDPTKEIPRT